MKRLLNIFSIITLLLVVLLLSACKTTTEATTVEQEVDYVENLKLDMSTTSKKMEVSVRYYIDGDTTHFDADSSVFEDGIVKARYLAVNTPESTGKVEEWGKAASKFTHSKLENATSVIIESDDANWNLDSTGGRYLLWIWYRTSDTSDYRNLNVELLQNGYAIASNSGQNRYGEICLSAIAQAKRLKLHIYSDEQDPDFYYGDAKPITLKELRLHTEDYNGTKVAVEGIVAKNSNDGIYIQDYDEELGMNIGMYVYYGKSFNGMDLIELGNRVLFVGTVSFYETGGTYQISGLIYNKFKPNDKNNCRLISQNNEITYTPITAADLKTTKKAVSEEIEGEVVTQNVSFALLAMDTGVSLTNLTVKSIYTTTNESSSSKGAMSITVESNGVQFVVRTAVLYDEDGTLVTKDRYEGKTINVKGFVDYYSGSYQVEVFSVNDIEIVK